MARIGRGMPNRPYIAHTSPGDTLDATTPTVWAVGQPHGRWHVADPRGRWDASPPYGRWHAGPPKGW